jgi:TRAP-type C4-dicarboxylate transport system permease large subunit
VATATEVSTIGIVYSALVGLFVYRRFDWKRLKPMLIDTASLSGAIIFIVGCATAMAWGLTQSGFSQDLARIMGALPGGAYGFLAVSIVAFIVLGSVLEGIPAIVLFGPLLFPIAKAAGVHEVHYAMVVIFAMGIGLFAPPFGVGYYGACAVSKVNPDEGIRHIWGYIAAMLVGLVIVAAFPWFSTGANRNESIPRRDSPAGLCRARHRGRHGLLEHQARRGPLVLQPQGAHQELPLQRRGA